MKNRDDARAGSSVAHWVSARFSARSAPARPASNACKSAPRDNSARPFAAIIAHAPRDSARWGAILQRRRHSRRILRGSMHKPVKYVEKGLTYAAQGAWVVFDALNSIKPNEAFTPKWSDKPLLKSWQKVKPPLGWPRETDSLCPVCVREARQEILDGKRDYKRAAHREDRRDQGDDHRARRQDPDGQGLPDPRPLRGRHGDGHRRSSSISKSPSRAPTSARTTTRSCTTTARRRSSTAAARC